MSDFYDNACEDVSKIWDGQVQKGIIIEGIIKESMRRYIMESGGLFLV